MTIMMSRLMTEITAQAGMRMFAGTFPMMDSAIKALDISNLSAMGSRTMPSSVIWSLLLAIPPSIASVNAAVANITVAINLR